ncbi:MAG: acyl-CoA dehydrogenase family protein [Acidimicrobiia bacterium]|nr:acyl-CoA dehydrogenase family protein [Acidimicrobiia bacterium]
MDPRYSPEAEQYRSHVRDFLAANLPAGWSGLGALESAERRDFVGRWRQLLAAERLLAVAWPREYGGSGLSLIERTVLAEEFTKAGVPLGNDNDIFSIGMLGHTLIEWGTPEQKDHFLPRILSGEHVWCQGYSEPNSGSDLASLATRAELDGDEWVINGQKIWTSQGHNANWIFVLCRTAPDERKHKGISFLLCPLDQPGIEVRPIVNAANHHDFNEVFFTDARAAAANVVGGVNNGWTVANTLLAYERGDDATVIGLRHRDEWDRLVAAARERGRLDDATIRQRLAHAYCKVEIMRYQGMRLITDSLRGYHQGPESSLNKLLWSHYHQALTELALDVIGVEATTLDGRDAATGVGVDDLGSPFSTRGWFTTFMGARPGTIYSGSSEIQRNIVGERVLGLPREPRVEEGSWAQSRRA